MLHCDLICAASLRFLARVPVFSRMAGRKLRVASAFSGMTVLALFPYVSAGGNDVAPAHYRKDCVACHARMTGGEGETLYRRKDRRLVNDYDALVKRVEYCREGSGAEWNRAQTGEVVEYLNRRFYRFRP